MNKTSIRSDLSRLARFGANISDAHSCFIFLNEASVRPMLTTPSRPSLADHSLVLGGWHSLSNEVLPGVVIKSKAAGLIGWVAEQSRSVHVSPFEYDSRTLGVYNNDQQLKSFIGIPIVLSKQTSAIGVMACDSKKSFAFSKFQVKLLEDLAIEVANVIQLHSGLNQQQRDCSWEQFLTHAETVLEELGTGSIEVIRIVVPQPQSLEQELGTSRYLTAMEQLYRLIEQSLPPQFPLYKLPNGDVVLIVDNMISAYYENKVRAVLRHVIGGQAPLTVNFHKLPMRSSRSNSYTLEEAISRTASEGHSAQVKYEYRRA